MLLFDTGKKLEKAFTKEQFEALVDMLEKRDDKLATSGELTAVKTELKSDILAVELRLQNDITEKISTAKHETLKWIMGMFIAQTGVLIALYAIMR